MNKADIEQANKNGDIGLCLVKSRVAGISLLKPCVSVNHGPKRTFIRDSDAALQSVETDIRCACEIKPDPNSHIADSAAVSHSAEISKALQKVLYL